MFGRLRFSDAVVNAPEDVMAQRAGSFALVQTAAVLAVLTLLVGLACWLSGLDAWVARAVFNPDSGWAWALRRWGAWSGGVAALVALGFCLIPGLWQRRPGVYGAALAVFLTAMLGFALVNQVTLKELIGRDRPRDSILVVNGGGISAETHGKSMPSGHTGLAGVLVAPYFVLRRRKPKVALGFLGGGLLVGAVVGLSRMVLGAHFMGDVLVALGINLSVAALVAAGILRWRRLPVRVVAGMLALAALLTVWFNAFSLTLRLELDGDVVYDLPCPVTVTPGMQGPRTLRVDLRGYGAPLSQLELVEEDRRVQLTSWRGLYRKLQCTAVVKSASTGPVAP